MQSVSVLMYRLFLMKSEVELKLREAFPDSEHGLVPVTCADVECTFEFIMYSFQGEQEVSTSQVQESFEQPLSKSPNTTSSGTYLHSRSPSPFPKLRSNVSQSPMPSVSPTDKPPFESPTCTSV